MQFCKNKKDNEKLWIFIKEYMASEKNKLIFLVLMIFGGTFIKNINPYLYGKMLDSISHSDMSFLHILVNIVISLYFVLKISIHLSSVAIFYIPTSVAVTFLSRRYFKRLAKERKQYNDKYYSFQNEVFSNNIGIKSYMLEDLMNEKFTKFISKELRILRRSIFLSNAMDFMELWEEMDVERVQLQNCW